MTAAMILVGQTALGTTAIALLALAVDGWWGR